MHSDRKAVWAVFSALCLIHAATGAPPTTQPASAPAGLAFISTAFENASPLQWSVDADGTVHVFLSYDYERSSPNRAAGHWFFQLQGRSGAELTVVLHNFDNVWNGRHGSPISKNTASFISADGQTWTTTPTEKIEGNALRFRAKLEGGSLYVARLEPYRISDLDRLIAEIRPSPLVQITTIGKTVQGRELEIIRVGRDDAPHRVVLRARAHPWEPGGNWVAQGLIRALLVDDALSRRCLERYCLYVMPMANKDGVARGWTRFNLLGKDLNRNWDKPPDPRLAPENHALETWLKGMIDRGRRPDLLIDFHNDEGGGLHISRPNVRLDAHLARRARLEQLLRKHTWFTEGSSGASFRNPGSIGEGLLERFGIDACVLEFNANWIAGLKQPATAAAWQQFGKDLREVFLALFERS